MKCTIIFIVFVGYLFIKESQGLDKLLILQICKILFLTVSYI